MSGPSKSQQRSLHNLGLITVFSFFFFLGLPSPGRPQLIGCVSNVGATCLECSRDYFSISGECFACVTLTPQCSACEDLTCTSCAFPFEVEQKVRSSDGKRYSECRKPVWMDSVIFLILLAVMPVLGTIVVTYIVLECYFECRYTKKCCKRVKPSNNVKGMVTTITAAASFKKGSRGAKKDRKGRDRIDRMESRGRGGKSFGEIEVYTPRQ